MTTTATALPLRTGFERRLAARPPFAGRALLAFLAGRAIPGVEQVTDGVYLRRAHLGGASGVLTVAIDATGPGVILRGDAALAPHAVALEARVSALFDLQADAVAIDRHLGGDPGLAAHVARAPGLRVPGAFDAWELAVRAILGQQVSVRGATTLSGRLVQRFGDRDPTAPEPIAWRFPGADRLAEATAAAVRQIGLPAARAATIVTLAQAVRDGAVDLAAGGDIETTVAALCQLRGIGDWTARYIAMRALRSPDVFLAGDLAARKALGVTSVRQAEQASARWRPFRAYALMHLWNSLSAGGG